MWANVYTDGIALLDKIMHRFFGIETVLLYPSKVNFCNF